MTPAEKHLALVLRRLNIPFEKVTTEESVATAQLKEHILVSELYTKLKLSVYSDLFYIKENRLGIVFKDQIIKGRRMRVTRNMEFIIKRAKLISVSCSPLGYTVPSFSEGILEFKTFMEAEDFIAQEDTMRKMEAIGE